MEDMFCQSPRWMKVSLVSSVLISGNIGLRWNCPAFVPSSLHRAKSQTLRAVSLPRSLLSRRRRRRSCGEKLPWVQSAFEKSAVGLSRYVSRVLPAADFHFRPAVLGCKAREHVRGVNIFRFSTAIYTATWNRLPDHSPRNTQHPLLHVARQGSVQSVHVASMPSI